MKSLRVQFVCFFLFLSNVSGLPVCGEENYSLNSKPMPFEDEFQEMFRNFNESDPRQIERFSQFFTNLNPYVSNDFDDLARMDDEYTDRANFVVSFKN